MKFKVETTIPMRQYENLKTSYECEHTEKEQAIQMAIEDLRKYNNFIKNNPEPPKETHTYQPKEGETAGGLKVVNGKWVVA